MPSSETELYFTVAEMIPYTAPLVKAVKLITAIYDFGKTNKTDEAIARLQQEVERIKAELASINERLNELEQRQLAGENRERWRALTEITIELESLSFRLSTDHPAAIANEAGLRAEVFLTDADLWLWSDVKTTELRDITEPLQTTILSRREELLPPDFKSFPTLSLYSFALAVYATAIILEARGNRDIVQRHHGARLRRHIEYISVRPDYRGEDTQPPPNTPPELQAPKTLPEIIRHRLTCRVEPREKYARNGVCHFTFVYWDAINRQSLISGDEMTIDTYPTGNDVLCTFPEGLLAPKEREFEDKDDGVVLLGELERMLRQLEMSGSLGTQFIGQFGAWSKLQQEFAICAHLAAGEGFLGAFPTFQTTSQGVDVYGGVVFLTTAAGERRDIPLAELPNVSLDAMNDAMFSELMRATNAYASRHGFVGGFPTGFWGDFGAGPVCTVILLKHTAAEWSDVYVTDLGGPALDNVQVRFQKTHDYAVGGGYVGAFPNLFHAHVGGGPFDPRREGIVCGTVFIKPGFGEWRSVFMFRGPS